MIKLLLIYVLTQIFVSSYVRTQYCVTKANFLEFLSMFNKTYSSPEETEIRYQIWVSNVEEINNLTSSGIYTFEIGERASIFKKFK